MRTVLASLALAATLAACAGAPAGHGDPGAGPEDPARLYRAKCSACHRPYAPASRTRGEWRAVLPRMAKRAHLSAAEAEALGVWLEAGASDAGAPVSAR